MSARRPPLAFLAAVMVLCSTPGTALADAPERVADITDRSRVLRVAEALAADPLYVHPSVGGMPSYTERRAMSDLVAAGLPDGTPLYVVHQPSVLSDETGGQPTLFLHALHEQIGAEGVYVAITTDQRIAVAAFDSEVTPEIDPEGLRWGARPDALLEEVVLQVGESPLAPVAATPLTRDPEPDPELRTYSPVPSGALFQDRFLPGILIGLITAVPYFALVHGRVTVPLLRRAARILRRRFGHRAHEPGPTLSLAPNHLWRWRLRPLLTFELQVLRHRITRAPDGHPELGRARQAYDAAGLVASSPRLPTSAMVCAIVLARHGEALLERPGEPLTAPCQVNPLHGAALNLNLLRLGGRERSWRTCDSCASDEAGPRTSLMAREGRSAVPFRDSQDVWARTTFTTGDPFALARLEIGV